MAIALSVTRCRLHGMGLATDSIVSQELGRLPAELRDVAARALHSVDAHGEMHLPDTIPIRPLLQLVACSEFASNVLRREADWFIAQGERLQQQPSLSDLRKFCDEIAVSEDTLEAVQGQIRRFRNRYYLHVLWREYARVASLNETLYAISDLADELLRAAASYAQRQVQDRYGVVCSEDGEGVDLLVLGMGKLGGRELNFSSDIDIVFLYPGGKESDGRKSINPQEYFARVARTVIALLDTPTADGFAFRVDTRLRPFGDSGPPVTSFAALESYLVQHGRDWERYAYVKARAVGPVPPAAVLADLNDNLISPFVYRRYLDYGVFESLREMHALIAAEVQRRELADNIKLGPGGIREIEFIVQALQLVRGGGQAELQGCELQKILPRLAGRHDLTQSDVEELLTAYEFLRRTENFIQAMRDRQTHDLPTDPVDQARLFVAMDYDSWSGFLSVLQSHRDNVARQFDKIAFRERAIAVGEKEAQDIRELWDAAGDAAAWAAAIREQGFGDAQALAEIMVRFKAAAAYADTTANRRLADFVPKLFVLLAGFDAPTVALQRVLEVIDRVIRRSAYIALLNENDAALAKLVDLCSRSVYVTRQLARYPVLLDELLDPGSYVKGISRETLTAELAERAAAIGSGDSEALVEMLTNFQRTTQFRIAIADYDETLTIMRVSDALTELAETVLQFALDIAWSDLQEKHGKPGDSSLAIVAYGKLGGLELSYGSDLDLVFLHDPVAAGAMTDGEKPLEYTMFFTRLVRRLMHLLTTQTTSGALYEVDTRLRPDGKSGLLVSSTEAFERYQEENAWTWEHQALLRARAVAGDPGVCARFDDIRSKTLCAGLHGETLRNDVLTMRSRMRSNLDKTDTENFDLKQGKGGIGDIEFLVQYLVLANAVNHSSVIEYTDNIRQLDALAADNLIDSATAGKLQDCYRTYRHRAHHLLLNELPTQVPQTEFGEQREYVSEVWNTCLGEPPA